MYYNLLVVAIYWVTRIVGGTAWNAEPERIRAHNFARRTRLTQSGIMIGPAVGGIILEMGKGWSALSSVYFHYPRYPSDLETTPIPRKNRGIFATTCKRSRYGVRWQRV